MPPNIRRAGPVRVTTAKDAVRAFRRATGWRDEDGAVPLSFPVVWMKSPEIGGPIREAAQEIGLPVHESQQFEYVQLLQVERVYDLMVELKREFAPPRLVATAQIFTLEGKSIGTVISTLRLIVPQSNGAI